MSMNFPPSQKWGREEQELAGLLVGLLKQGRNSRAQIAVQPVVLQVAKCHTGQLFGRLCLEDVVPASLSRLWTRPRHKSLAAWYHPSSHSAYSDAIENSSATLTSMAKTKPWAKAFCDSADAEPRVAARSRSSFSDSGSGLLRLALAVCSRQTATDSVHRRLLHNPHTW